jgi:hypothetical protein
MAPHRFDLARIDFDNPDPCCDELLPQSVGEASNSSFSGTINAASRVRLSSRYASNVDDIPSTTLISLLKDGKNGLSHIDQANGIGRKHDVDIFGGNVRRFRNTFDQSTITTS